MICQEQAFYDRLHLWLVCYRGRVDSIELKYQIERRSNLQQWVKILKNK